MVARKAKRKYVGPNGGGRRCLSVGKAMGKEFDLPKKSIAARSAKTGVDAVKKNRYAVDTGVVGVW